ncbi:MAG: hypothetical protein P8X79_05185 [Reinekea sp.]
MESRIQGYLNTNFSELLLVPFKVCIIYLKPESVTPKWIQVLLK